MNASDISTMASQENKITALSAPPVAPADLRPESVRSMHALAGGVAHMFNNLLAAMIGQLELVISELPVDAKTSADVRVALADARKMAELCHRTISRCGTGVFHMTPVDLRSVISRAAGLVARQVPPHVNIHLDSGPAAVWVAGDAKLLEILTANLLVNALEAMQAAGGTVTVSARMVQVDEKFRQAHVMSAELKPGAYAALAVADTGYGMDEHIAARALAPLFSTKGPGRGLGLVEVQGIALIHNGSVAFETQLGAGSTFLVLLPTGAARSEHQPEPRAFAPSVAAAPASAAPAPAPVASASRGAVLVVDDEEGIRRYAVRVLQGMGLTTFVASDGPEAVELFQEHADEVDLVLLDVFMVHMHGDQVLRILRRMRPDVRIQLMSGYQKSALAELFDKRDLATLLLKPFATTDFINNVQRAIRQKRERT
ncbi:MAG: response regulator [bacterium]